MVKGSVDKNISCSSEVWPPRPPSSHGGSDTDADDLVEAWNPDRPITSDFLGFLGPDVGVPRRYLPHMKLTSLYWLLLATAHDDPCSGVLEDGDDGVPSYSTFRRVWRASWRKCLGLRKSSQHAECKICFEYRQELKNACVTIAQRLEYARDWRAHLRGAYHDRMIYWWCRYASRHSMDVLTIIVDSMDRAKFAWPQYPWGRNDKTLEKYRRPRLVVTGALAHGYGTFLFLAHEEVSHGSAAFCKVLLQVLEAVWGSVPKAWDPLSETLGSPER